MPAAWYGLVPLPVFWQVNGLTMTGGPDDLGCYWSVLSGRGWRGSGKPRNTIPDRVNASGGSFTASYREARVITLGDVRVKCPSRDVRARVEQRLAGLFPDRPDMDLFPVVRVDESGLRQTRYVALDDDLDPVPKGPLWLDFDLQLIAPDPRAFGDWTTAEAGPPTSGTGGIISTGAGIVSTGAGITAGVSGRPSAATVTGAGTAPNPVVYELIGAVDDVVIADQGGLSRVRYRGSIPDGQSVFINCDDQPAYGVPGAAGPIPPFSALYGTWDASSAVTVTGAYPTVAAGAGAVFAIVAGQIASTGRLRVHTRAVW